MKLDGIALIQPSKTSHSQGGVHIYGVVPHSETLEVDLVNTYLNYFIEKDYDYIGYLGPNITLRDPRTIQKLAVGLAKWNLDMIGPECGYMADKYHIGLRDEFQYGWVMPECWLTTPDTVRAILEKYGYFLDQRYKSPLWRSEDLRMRMYDTDMMTGMHRGIVYDGFDPKDDPRQQADSERFMNQYYAIRTSGEEEDSDSLEHADNNEQE